MGTISDASNLVHNNNHYSILIKYRKLFLNCGYTLPVFLLLFFIIGIVRQFTIPINLPPNTNCQNSQQFYLNSLILLSVFIIGLVAAIYFIRNIKDQFNISNELKVVCGSFILLLFPFLIINFVYTTQRQGKQPYTIYLLLLWTTITYISSILLPLIASYKYNNNMNTIQTNQKLDEWNNCDIVNSFEKLIESEEGLKSYIEYSITEFSVENIMCYLDIESYKKIDDIHKLKERAIEIYNKYFRIESELLLNVDSVIIDPIKTTVQPLIIEAENKKIANKRTSRTGLLTNNIRNSIFRDSSLEISVDKFIERTETEFKELDELKHLFDHVEVACYDLMRNSSYPRYLKSVQCKKLILKCKKEEITKKTIEELNLNVI